MVIPRKGGVRPPSLRLPCIALMVLLLALPAAAADTQAQLKAKTADLARVKAKIAAVSKALAADRGQQGDLQAAVEAAERREHDARAKLAAVVAKLKAQDARLAAAQSQQKAVETELQAQRTALASQLRAAYMMGGDDRLRLLLSGRDPGLVGRMLGYYGYLGRARDAVIAGIDARLKQLAALEAEIADQRQQLAELRDHRRQALDDLRDDRKARAVAVEQLKARIADRGRHLQDLRASEQQIEKLLDSLRSALAHEPYDLGNHRPFAQLKGTLPWPLRGALLARFGQTKAGGPLEWKGVWIAATAGAPIRACAHGRVVYVGWLSSYGLIVLLEHDHGYFTLYGHDDSADVKVGEWVDAGQVIGHAGDTGGYERSGVYFEIRRGNQALDPGRWLVKSAGR